MLTNNTPQEANSNPNTACGGTVTEMVYPGGELAFVMRMLEDSVTLGSRVHWWVVWRSSEVAACAASISALVLCSLGLGIPCPAALACYTPQGARNAAAGASAHDPEH